MDSHYEVPIRQRPAKKRRLLPGLGLILSAVLLVAAWPGRTTEPKAAAEPSEAAEAEDAVSGYTTLTVSQEELALGDLSLVSNDHACSFPAGLELASVYEGKNSAYEVRDTTVYVAARVLEPLNQMAGDFKAATGNCDLLVCAGYRSKEDQQSLWDNAMETHGEAYTLQYFSQPGYSEHHTGLAVDFSFYQVSTGTAYDFAGSGDGAWMIQNSWKYGFVQRYPSDKVDITGISEEAWHFRYVGKVHSQIMHEQNLCLEEYIDLLSGYSWDGEHLSAEVDGITYEIYICDADDIHVPERGSYTLSGDNLGRCIVTVCKEA